VTSDCQPASDMFAQGAASADPAANLMVHAMRAAMEELITTLSRANGSAGNPRGDCSDEIAKT
ncbi:unnamed protein product, partial [Prorocentrum cordatum]